MLPYARRGSDSRRVYPSGKMFLQIRLPAEAGDASSVPLQSYTKGAALGIPVHCEIGTAAQSRGVAA